MMPRDLLVHIRLVVVCPAVGPVRPGPTDSPPPFCGRCIVGPCGGINHMPERVVPRSGWRYRRCILLKPGRRRSVRKDLDWVSICTETEECLALANRSSEPCSIGLKILARDQAGGGSKVDTDTAQWEEKDTELIAGIYA
ncbi:hypothetical protein BJV78DRAFT_559500 [Lactifluus subvellereus]|nr:hypothetical protein BJV78DRAFT_559500 [Lactifluus subvellereus]